MSATSLRPLAAITSASTGIGFELARCCAEHGYDLLITADEPRVYEAAHELRSIGGRVGALQTDLATRAGVDRFYAAAQGRPIEALVANSGRGIDGAFLDQELDHVRRVIEMNVGGTVYLLHRVAFDMRARGRGRILVTGSTAHSVRGGFRAVYDATQAFVAAFSAALREELRAAGVTVTCLMPGRPETDSFERVGLEPALERKSAHDEAEIARAGFAAMQNGDATAAGAWKSSPQSSAAALTH